jgi:hypothetical protein
MDTFCLGCHDSDGASNICVKSDNTGLETSTTKACSRRLTPFNTADTLQNAREPTTTTPAVPTLWRDWRVTNNKVINVKDQFNSGNAYGKGWASHHNLNQFKLRYETSAGVKTTNSITEWPAGAWTPPDATPAAGEVGMTWEGKQLNSGASDTGFAVGLHCSDCHLNESNAHGTRSTWYMLQDKTGTDNPFSATGTSTSTEVCAKCHNPATYGEGSTTTTSGYSRVQAHDGTNGRCNNIAGGDQDGFATLGWTGGTGAGNQLPCLGCHGGYGGPSNSNADGTSPTNVGPGLIHGTNAAYKPYNGAGYSRMYRFMGTGGSYRYYSPTAAASPTDPTSWESTGTTGCYTIGAVDQYGTCAKHSGVSPAAPNRTRKLQY